LLEDPIAVRLLLEGLSASDMSHGDILCGFELIVKQNGELYAQVKPHAVTV
jgi:hypothetical protein